MPDHILGITFAINFQRTTMAYSNRIIILSDREVNGTSDVAVICYNQPRQLQTVLEILIRTLSQ